MNHFVAVNSLIAVATVQLGPPYFQEQNNYSLL